MGLPGCIHAITYFFGVDLRKNVDVEKTQSIPNPIEHSNIAVTSDL